MTLKLVTRPPHPDRWRDPTSPRTRGEVEGAPALGIFRSERHFVRNNPMQSRKSLISLDSAGAFRCQLGGARRHGAGRLSARANLATLAHPHGPERMSSSAPAPRPTVVPAAVRPAIRIRNLTKSFGPLVAVDDVSLDIGQGEFFMIVGPSGCGKTTLLRILAGLEAATSGDDRDRRRGDSRPARRTPWCSRAIRSFRG